MLDTKSVKKSNLSYTIKKSSQTKSNCFSYDFNRRKFAKYIFLFMVSFAVFFIMLYISTIIKENSFDDALAKSFKNNSMLSLLLSLFFSVFTELTWETGDENDFVIPKKILISFSLGLVVMLFLLYNTFDVLSTTAPENVLFSVQLDLNIACSISSALLALSSFALLSLSKKY